MIRRAALLASFVLASCASEPPVDAKRVDSRGEVTLAPGESVVLQEKMMVRLVNVVEASRCPVDTTCVWAGEVKVLLEGSKEVMAPTYLRAGDSTRIGTHQVTVVRVEPQPVSTAKIARQDYRATLKIDHAP